ncbi:MAG: 8-oxo-dGTP diphosphatase [Candidatus Pacebacteria bacterium]|nr:8-oxo-dGTP diphosphatase [Candidatus Paceibacterota bacterium]
MKNTTLLFLIKKNGDTITELCLAMKKRGFGANRYNGVGGKLQGEETIEQAVIRETKEEIDVVAKEMYKVAILDFAFANKPEWNQRVHTFFCTSWDGVPTESEEMKPEWFPVDAIPYDNMWPDDMFWLPRVLKGEFIKGKFTFGDGDVILDQHLEAVSAQTLG